MEITEHIFSPDKTLESFIIPGLENTIIKERLGYDLTDELNNFLNDKSIYLESLNAEYCLIHADFKPTNIMIKDGRVNGILDWEFSFSFSFLFDIGQFIRYDEEIPKSLEDSFIKGYKKGVKAFPEEWRKSAKLLDLINLLFFLMRKEEKPLIFNDVRQLIKNMIIKWD